MTEFREVATINEFIDAIRIRANVFIVEQCFQPGWEPDEDDKTAMQYIAIVAGNIVGTCRARETAKNEFKLERMAIKKDYRRKGIGREMLKYVISKLTLLKPNRIWLSSQVQAQKFYEKYGFRAVSAPYDQFGKMHIDLEMYFS